MRQPVSLQKFCCHKLGFICSTQGQMLLSFYIIPPQPPVESSLILGSKLIRSIELRFIVESFHCNPHRVVTIKASNSQKHCTSCWIYQQEEIKSKWDLYSISIIYAHYMCSQIQALNLKHIFPCLVLLLHCVNECLKVKYMQSCIILLLLCAK